MPEIGKIIAHKRTTLGITLPEAAAATKIRIQYLEAIEKEAYEVLPGEIYIRAFVSKYAQYLGLSDDETIQAFLKGAKSATDLLQTVEVIPAKSRSRSEEYQQVVRSSFPSLKTLATIIFGVAVVALIIVQFIYSDLFPASLRENPAVSPAPTTDVIVPPLSSEPEPSETGEPAARTYTKIIVTLDVPKTDDNHEEQCWIQVTGDQEVLFEGMIKEGTRTTYEANEIINLRLGNSGIVLVTVNGEELGHLGGVGEVVNRVFTLNNIIN